MGKKKKKKKKKKKTGVNDPCICGSGKKYKKCCLPNMTSKKVGEPIRIKKMSPRIKKMLDEQNQKIQERKLKYGEVDPIIQAHHDGHQLIAVGNEIFFTKKGKTFPDFLSQFLPHILGQEWIDSEIEKPIYERHQIMQWFEGMYQFQKIQTKKKEGIYEIYPNGDMLNYLLLSYHLYVLRHKNLIQKGIIKRLKHHDQFQGARFELFVAATCVRAGFEIEFEDESDISKKHNEFEVTIPYANEKLSVEAKSKHRSGTLGFRGEQDIKTETVNVKTLLLQAFKKPKIHPRIIFVELNLPPFEGPIKQAPWFDELFEQITEVENRKGEDSFEAIAITNHSYHYAKGLESAPKGNSLLIFSKKYTINNPPPEYLQRLRIALDQFSNIPNEFDE